MSQENKLWVSHAVIWLDMSVALFKPLNYLG